MKINQFAVEARESGSATVYGLGDDNRVYKWNASNAEWIPFWDTRSEEQKETDKRAVERQFERGNLGNIGM